jgi:hypothetical protein
VTLDGDAIVPGEVTFVSSVGQFRLAHGIYEFNFKAERRGRSFFVRGRQTHFLGIRRMASSSSPSKRCPLIRSKRGMAAGSFPVVADPVTNAETLKGGDGAAINGMRITRRPLGVPVFGRKWDLVPFAPEYRGVQNLGTNRDAGG